MTITTQNNEKTTQLWSKGLLMQCHSLNIEKVQTLEGYTLRFWKNIFGLSILTLYTLAKHVSVANMAMDSMVNVTLNLASCSNTNLNRAFSLTWPASTLIYWNKRKHLQEKRVELPEDFLGTPTWPLFHCFGTPIWPPWRHVKTLCRRKWN